MSGWAILPLTVPLKFARPWISTGIDACPWLSSGWNSCRLFVLTPTLSCTLCDPIPPEALISVWGVARVSAVIAVSPDLTSYRPRNVPLAGNWFGSLCNGAVESNAISTTACLIDSFHATSIVPFTEPAAFNFSSGRLLLESIRINSPSDAPANLRFAEPC